MTPTPHSAKAKAKDEQPDELVTIVLARFGEEHQGRLSLAEQPIRYTARRGTRREVVEDLLNMLGDPSRLPGQRLRAALEDLRDGAAGLDELEAIADTLDRPTNGAPREHVTRVVEALPGIGVPAAADTVAERVGLERDEALLALEQAWTEGTVSRQPVDGADGPLWARVR